MQTTIHSCGQGVVAKMCLSISPAGRWTRCSLLASDIAISFCSLSDKTEHFCVKSSWCDFLPAAFSVKSSWSDRGQDVALRNLPIPLQEMFDNSSVAPERRRPGLPSKHLHFRHKLEDLLQTHGLLSPQIVRRGGGPQAVPIFVGTGGGGRRYLDHPTPPLHQYLETSQSL
jgi:hypothetical protein